MLHVLALVTLGCVNIFGELSPSERAAAMRRFQEGAVRILVATDVLPAGIDVNHVMHVGTGAGQASKLEHQRTQPAHMPPLHAQRTVVQPSEFARGSLSFLSHSGEVGPSNSQPHCMTSIQARSEVIISDGHWLLRILDLDT